jgi:hypothetical protein
MHCTLELLIPNLCAHCFVDFCGDCVNCTNIIVEKAGLIVVQHLPDVGFCTLCPVPQASKLSQLHVVVNCVGTCRFTEPLSLYFSHIFRLPVPVQNYLGIARMIIIPLPFDKVTLAFIWLAPSLREYHTTYLTWYLGLTLKSVSRWPVLKCVYIFLGLSVLCKIWGFHSGDYEEWHLLGCYAVWLL